MVSSQLIFLHLPSSRASLCSERRPGTVLDQTYRAVLEVVFHQTGDVVVHERIDACVVGCGGKDQFAVAEGVGESQRHIVSCQIVYDNLRTSLLLNLSASRSTAFFVCP